MVTAAMVFFGLTVFISDLVLSKVFFLECFYFLLHFLVLSLLSFLIGSKAHSLC